MTGNNARFFFFFNVSIKEKKLGFQNPVCDKTVMIGGHH